MKTPEMRAKYYALMAEARTLLAKPELTAEQRTQIDAKFTEARALAGDIKLAEEADAASAEQRTRELEGEARARAGRPALPQPGDGNTGGDAAQREADQAQVEQRNRQYQAAFRRYLIHKDDSELRAMNSTAGAQGGYLIPTLTQPQLEVAILQFGGVIPSLDLLETATGAQINWPTNDDTPNAGREIGENVDAQETDLVTGTVPLNVGLFSTDVILVPRTLLRDSTVDLVGRIVTALGVRQARLESRMVINGSQTTQSFGSLLNTPPVGATAATPTDISLIDMANIFGAVDPGYAVNGKFVMSRATQIYLSTLRNQLGAPIFQIDASGLLVKLFGCDVVIDQNMPQVAAAAKAVIFGDLKKYILRRVGTMEVMRLEERYATANQIAFLGFWSAGGRLIDAGTHPVKVLQQHA